MPDDDSWSVQSHGYKISNFYTRSTDSRGHKESIHLKVPPEIASTMSQIVQKGSIPQYRTVQDLIRDAIVHRLHYLNEQHLMDQESHRLVHAHILISNQIRMMEDHATYQQHVAELAKQCKRLMETGPEGRQEAEEQIREAIGHIMVVEDSPFWKKRYLETLQQILGDISSYIP